MSVFVWVKKFFRKKKDKGVRTADGESSAASRKKDEEAVKERLKSLGYM
ncbi:MAG: hypothetical protein HQL30_06475 [Candidatus Omnitrophica bacterium]|nr:hypothetical protein [Candidatus Omnitrophota bacterium]